MNYYRHLVNEEFVDFINMYDHLAYEGRSKNLGGHILTVPNVKKLPKSYAEELGQILAYESETQYVAVHVNMLSAANELPLLVASKENERRRKAGVKELHIIAHSHNSGYISVIKKIYTRRIRTE